MTRTPPAAADDAVGYTVTIPVRRTTGPRGSWRTVNITSAERAGRILAGLAGVVSGVILLIGAGSVLAVVLEALLIAAGLDLVVTGALGHCPVYARIGYLPKSLRGSR